MNSDTPTRSGEPEWLAWVKRLQAVAQDGLLYVQNPFDLDRYETVRRVAAEMMAFGSGSDLEPVLESFSAQTGYATPKVDVRAAVFRDNAILMVRELSDGNWTLPGGWADPNEPPSAAVEREVREESGFTARAVKLLAVLDRTMQGHVPPHPFHVYKLFFRCELTGGASARSMETDGAAFFRENELPPLSLARVTPAQIARLFDHSRHPDWPTDFD
jgi:ADP-ribose pyrophosphatase YjhB (NUDIX family)